MSVIVGRYLLEIEVPGWPRHRERTCNQTNLPARWMAIAHSNDRLALEQSGKGQSCRFRVVDREEARSR